MEFEYSIIKYPSDKFEHLTYFCTAEGECDLKGVPSDQIGELSKLMTLMVMYEEKGENNKAKIIEQKIAILNKKLNNK